MNTNSKLRLEQEANKIPKCSWDLRMREKQINNIMMEYGYDRGNAEKVFEYQCHQGQQVLFNSAIGAAVAYKALPFQHATASYYPLFRKAFMKYNIPLVAFAGGYYCASML